MDHVRRYRGRVADRDPPVSTHRLTEVVRVVAEEWARDGRLHVPPDDCSKDDDLAFWNEVERRLAAEENSP
jgi:hypothetical protein